MMHTSNTIRTQKAQRNQKAYENVFEMCHFGAALGEGCFNTSKLRPMKYGPAMEGKDKDKWVQAVSEEYDRMG